MNGEILREIIKEKEETIIILKNLVEEKDFTINEMKKEIEILEERERKRHREAESKAFWRR